MNDFKQQLIELRNHVSRYGTIIDDASCEIDGNHDRITTYKIDGKKITISMHNGDVSRITF